jgi:hypothetical protein
MPPCFVVSHDSKISVCFQQENAILYGCFAQIEPANTRKPACASGAGRLSGA